jgi:outer membrane protein insertion porin family
LRLTSSAYDGSVIRLRQSKSMRRGGRRPVNVTIPVGAPLKVALDATAKRSPVILTTIAGTPWTSDGFRASWTKARAKAGIVGLTFTKAAVREDVARIVEAYHRNGRYQVEVKPTTTARGDGRVDLIFEIREGPKTGVKHLAFLGNHEFGESRLEGVVKTTESGWFSFLKTSDVYDPDRVENDAELLRRFYVKNGFADAHVSATAAYDPAQQGFTLTFTIHEGARYRLGSIEIQSRVAALDGASVRDVMHLAQGQVFDGEAIDKAANAIAVAAGKRGFPFVDVRPHANHD